MGQQASADGLLCRLLEDQFLVQLPSVVDRESIASERRLTIEELVRSWRMGNVFGDEEGSGGSRADHRSVRWLGSRPRSGRRRIDHDNDAGESHDTSDYIDNNYDHCAYDVDEHDHDDYPDGEVR